MTGTLDEIVEKTGLALSTVRIRIKEERDGMKLKEIRSEEHTSELQSH